MEIHLFISILNANAKSTETISSMCLLFKCYLSMSSDNKDNMYNLKVQNAMRKQKKYNNFSKLSYSNKKHNM